MKSYLGVLKVPLALAALNSLCSGFLYEVFSEPTATGVFNAVRVMLVLVAGWLVITKNIGGLWRAALAGALLQLVDHVLIKGGRFLLEGETKAFGGVLISYVMYIWVPLLVGFLGGLAAKLWLWWRPQTVT